MKKLSTLLCLSASIFGWSQDFNEIAKHIAFDRSEEDRFGYAVDITDNYAIVGAYADDFGEVDPNMGSAYIFEKTGANDWTFVQKIINSDQDDYDRFGWSVAIDGDYAVVGAYGEDENVDDDENLSKAGSAYIFERGDDGVWVEVQKIVPSDREEDDQFGWAVDISGSTILVGAPHEDHDEAGGSFIFRTGSVYLFDRGDDGVWTESQKVVAWDRQPDSGGGDETMSVWHYIDIDYGDLFGSAVSISGDFMIVGARNGDYNADGTGGVDQSGTAYIYRRVGGTWLPDQKVTAISRHGWDRFGYSVAIDSNVAIVGAKAEDHGLGGEFLHNSGSAFIYTRDETGFWGVQKVLPSERGVGDHFGISVGIDGDFLVIGAESNNHIEETLENTGAAFIFEKNDDGTWSETQKISASDKRYDDVFAECIRISDHTIIAGAWQQDLNEISEDSIVDAGAAYFFSNLICEELLVEQSVELCSGETLTIGEHVYDASGDYIDTLHTLVGCDSIVHTSLYIAEPLLLDQNVTLCSGEAYEIGDHVYDLSGEYIDTLVSLDGCDSIVHTNLSILDEIIFEQSIELCAGETISVGASVYSETGEYENLLTSIDGCDSTVFTSLTVAPAIDVTINFEDVITLAGGDPTVETTTFQWVTCPDYDGIDGATEQTFTATENGDYAVIITDGGCSDTSECVTISHVGLTQNNLDDISIYPNPSQGMITIQLPPEMNTVSVTISDQLGAVVFSTTLSDQQQTFDFNHLATGTYFVMLTANEKQVIHKLVIRS